MRSNYQQQQEPRRTHSTKRQRWMVPFVTWLCVSFVVTVNVVDASDATAPLISGHVRRPLHQQQQQRRRLIPLQQDTRSRNLHGENNRRTAVATADDSIATATVQVTVAAFQHDEPTKDTTQIEDEMNKTHQAWLVLEAPTGKLVARGNPLLESSSQTVALPPGLYQFKVVHKFETQTNEGRVEESESAVRGSIVNPKTYQVTLDGGNDNDSSARVLVGPLVEQPLAKEQEEATLVSYEETSTSRVWTRSFEIRPDDCSDNQESPIATRIEQDRDLQQQSSSSSVPIKIRVKADDFPNELAWSLYETDANQTLYVPILQGTDRSDAMFLPSPGCYAMHASDAMSDGVCCDYGNGSVKVKVNGQLASTSTNFGSSTGLMGFCIDETGTLVTTEGEPYPTTTEATFPVKINITADLFAGETSWTLQHKSTPTSTGYDVTDASGNYEPHSLWLPPGEYAFEMQDEMGDGICCEYGDGSFRVVVNNQVVLSSGGEFGFTTGLLEFVILDDGTSYGLVRNTTSANPDASVTTTAPSMVPTKAPSDVVNVVDTTPTSVPTESPTVSPVATESPSGRPTTAPTGTPSFTTTSANPDVSVTTTAPSMVPTEAPSDVVNVVDTTPSASPSVPTNEPTTSDNISSEEHSSAPTKSIVVQTNGPTGRPQQGPSPPTSVPTESPTVSPVATKSPSGRPTTAPTGTPSFTTTIGPTWLPPSSRMWYQLGSDLDGDDAGEKFGHSVACSADGLTIAVGSVGTSEGSHVGSVRVLEYQGANAWSQVGPDLDFPTGGMLVDISADGTVLAVGSDNMVGLVRVYKRNETTWIPIGQDWPSGAVALSSDGQTLAIGDPLADLSSFEDSGAVRVYRYSHPPEDEYGGSWLQIGQAIWGAGIEVQFGSALALSSDGSIMAVGAHRGEYARVYGFNGTLWNQQGQNLMSEAPNDAFGYAVALSADGRTLAVSAIFNDGGAPEAGHVRVFEYSNDLWNQMGDDIDVSQVYSLFGTSVDLAADGLTLAVGATHANGQLTPTGQVIIFKYDTGNSWYQNSQEINGEGEFDHNGQSVALSENGSVVVMGAHYNDNDSGIDSGHVRVFVDSQPTMTSWEPIDVDLYGSEGDLFGQSVALSSDGRIMAVGAGQRNEQPTPSSVGPGYARVFVYNGSSEGWDQLGQDLLGGPGAEDQFGKAVALSSDGWILAVGASGETIAGYVRIFRYTEEASSWMQMGQDLEGPHTNDRFGSAIDLSDDGTIVAVGAYAYDSNGADGPGHGFGLVRVFEYDTSLWNQRGSDLAGEVVSRAGEALGWSVALSADGSVVATGSRARENLSVLPEGGNPSQWGSVKVYKYDPDQTEWSPRGQEIFGVALYNLFGHTMALSSDGTILAVGAPRHDTGDTRAGEVRVFGWNPTSQSWLQMGQDLNGMNAGVEFGLSVDLSWNGTTLVVGDGFGNGHLSGIIRVFEYDATFARWNRVGEEIKSDALGDGFGAALAISSDASVIAAGSRLHDGIDYGAMDAGRVRVFFQQP